MNRRTMLKAVALAGVTSMRGVNAEERRTTEAASAELKQSVLRYLASLARPDGGFAWEDQEQSHLTPTYAAIGCYHALGETPPNKQLLATFVRAHHPSRLKKLEQEHRIFDFQQLQSLAWLGASTSDLRPAVQAMRRPVAYLKQYEQHGYPVFKSEMAAILCRPLVGLAAKDTPPVFIDYLNSRRRANGSFNNTPATDGGDGHVMNTWWGLRALDVLRRTSEQRDDTIAWLRACQLPNGGFTHSPKPEFGGVSDAGYTWSAARALALLDSEPINRDACINFLLSLANADGGFADQPGWLSNTLATYYVVDALAALGALRVQPSPPASARAQTKGKLPSGLNVYTIQLEAPGQGSPSDALDLAATLKIHLWGAKNAKPEWIARAQVLADARKVPVTYFASNEEYGTWINVPGLGTYSHMSDVVVPAGRDIGPPLTSSAVSWPEFRDRRLAPLQAVGGRLIWQFGENEELVRMLLDDSLARGGHAAISTFHFGNPDFTNTEPFLLRWRGQIPFVALQDTHAAEPWWSSDLLTGFRTVFLAKEPTWDGWLESLANNWTVAIRHDAASNYQTWMHGASPDMLKFVRDREPDWRWWTDAKTIQRPWVTCTILKPGDPFEAGAPVKASALRLRCWWDCTNHGIPKRQLVEPIRLTLAGQPLAVPPPTEKKSQKGELLDHYHLFPLTDPPAGPTTVTATLRHIADGSQKELTLNVTV